MMQINVVDEPFTQSGLWPSTLLEVETPHEEKHDLLEAFDLPYFNVHKLTFQFTIDPRK